MTPEAEAELEAHLASCTACRAALAEMRRVDELLHVFADPPVDEARLDGLWQRVDRALDDAPMAAAADASAPAYLSDAPVLVPEPASTPRWLVPTLVAGGVAVVAVAVLAVALVVHQGRQDGTKAKRLAQADHPMSGEGPRPSVGSMDVPDRKAGTMGSRAGDDRGHDMAVDSMAAGDMAGGDMKAADDRKAGDSKSDSGMSASGRRRRVRRRASSGGGSSRHYGGGGHAAMRPRPRPMSGGGGHHSMSGGSSSLQDLLRAAGGMKSMSGGGGGGNLPKRLSPGDIRRGVGRVLGSARACYKRYRVAGTARVRVVISGASGRPSRVRVLGSFAGTPTGRCVQRAFRRARFERFGSGSQSFVFPLVFR